jgi:hypothetical protein
MPNVNIVKFKVHLHDIFLSLDLFILRNLPGPLIIPNVRFEYNIEFAEILESFPSAELILASS